MLAGRSGTVQRGIKEREVAEAPIGDLIEPRLIGPDVAVVVVDQRILRPDFEILSPGMVEFLEAVLDHEQGLRGGLHACCGPAEGIGGGVGLFYGLQRLHVLFLVSGR